MVLVGCSTNCGNDPVCGPEGAPPDGLVASSPEVTLTFTNLTGGTNNDCPAQDQPPPDGIVSVTIAGTQSGGTGLLTLCVERPDQFGTAASLGVDTQGSPVHVVDVFGEANGCTYDYDSSVPPTGTARGTGICDIGDAPFALELDGDITMERTCGATVDKIVVSLSGRAAVQ